MTLENKYSRVKTENIYTLGTFKSSIKHLTFCKYNLDMFLADPFSISWKFLIVIFRIRYKDPLII